MGLPGLESGHERIVVADIALLLGNLVVDVAMFGIGLLASYHQFFAGANGFKDEVVYLENAKRSIKLMQLFLLEDDLKELKIKIENYFH